MILAGDVGGTKVILALIDPDAGAMAIVAEQRFETDEYDGLEAIVRTFSRLAPRAARTRPAAPPSTAPASESPARS